MILNDAHTDWDDGDNDTRPAIVTLHTNGRGYWTSVAKPVQVTELKLHVYETDDADDLFGELRVHFNTTSWRPDRDGLIYTDKRFAQELKAYLNSIGLDSGDVGYSEQGMQGDNYVSCDAGKKFIESWRVKHPDAVKE